MANTNASSRNSTWQQVVSQSDRLVTFTDLCGHEKYLKTTIFGLVGQCPDYTMIIVNANAGFQRMSREHLGTPRSSFWHFKAFSGFVSMLFGLF